MKSNKIEYDAQSLIIKGKRKILIGGEFHYFRVPAQLWEDRLRKIRQSGCNLVTTYIPWNYHEDEKWKFNWQGDKNLPEFLRLCKKYGLYVIIKPGPYINAELDCGGLPHWLLAEDIPIRVPDNRYLQIAREWYKEVAKIIKPFLITNGGNIVLIQIENEYDHLIEQTDIIKDNQRAKKYFLKLLKFIREEGIDIPAFTNEGRCILGTEVINTHTYYPNIPWLWEWEFQSFDRKIEESRRLQQNKPLMILELEAGWFAQFGEPPYEVEPEVIEAITKTVIAYGASVLNYYMFVGGTTFPYWPARGEFGKIGICTSYDFGASPVREWGEIHKKYHIIRNFAYFLNSFPEIIFEGKTIKNNIDFYKGGENIARIYKNKSKIYNSFKDSYENVKILQKKSSKYGIVIVRNLEDEEKEIQIIFNSTIIKSKIIFPQNELKLLPHSSLLLPVDFHIDNNIQIVYSTSEIIARKRLNDIEYIILRGRKGTKGEMLLNCKNNNIKVLEGNVKVEMFSKKYIRLLYSHTKIVSFKIKDLNFIILPEEESQKLWINDNFIMITDFYYLNEIKDTKEKLNLNFQIKNEKNQKIILWCKRNVKGIKIEGKQVNFRRDDTGKIELKYNFTEKNDRNKIYWIGNWKYYPDTFEKDIDFDDSKWEIIDSSTPLEKAGFFTHGYYWYRSEFTLAKNFSNIKINLSTNNIDRFTLYINGRFKWIGIGSPELDITELVKEGRNIIAICYENAFHTKGYPSEGPLKKMSGLYYPVEVIYEKGNNKQVYKIKEWRIQQGLRGVINGYYLNEFNDKEWGTIPKAKKYVFEKDMRNIIWLRRWFYYHKEKKWEAPVYIEIDKLNERCLIYVNGFLLGKYEDIGPQHRFYIPENLLQEKNLLTLVIEGPGFHPVKQTGFLPPKFEEPKLGFYYQAKNINVALLCKGEEK